MTEAGASPATTPDDVLRFWFGEPGGALEDASKRWFTKSPAFDDEIRQRFSSLMARAAAGELDGWATGPGAAKGNLALIVLFDQMSRNVHRDTPAAFATDARALDLCARGIDSGLVRELSFIERYMFLMPLMHAEDVAVARRSVESFAALADEGARGGAPENVQRMLVAALDYAKKHAVIIERFGRYPHRNALLGRTSTAEELAFLEQPGSSF